MNIRHEESPTLHTFCGNFFKITCITSSYLKKRVGWRGAGGGRSPPPSIGKQVVQGGLCTRHDTLFMFRKNCGGGGEGGESFPCVQTVEIEGCDTC